MSQQTSSLRLMILAVCASGMLVAVKFAAYMLTGSAAILSDALESIINVATSGFALYSVYLGGRPPDFRHPYGHGKVEYFSAGFEGALIMLAAVAILYKAIPAFLHERVLIKLELGILVMLGTSLVNLALGISLVRTGRRIKSIAVEADGKHLLTDVYTSVGVVGGLILVRLTGWQRWDPLVACIVAVNIVVSGWRLLGESFQRLMDRADPELLGRIVEILNQHRQPEWIDIHQLRARRYGQRVHLDLHLILPRTYGLVEAHAQAKEIERILLESLDEVDEVIVHLDPCEDPLCWQCQRQKCEDRIGAGGGTDKPWRLEDLVTKRRHSWQ
ncbi:MAG: cation diffusion facilitator family transporter [Syntrophobacteria bacterium]